MNRPLRNMLRIVAAVVALTGIALFSLWLILPSAWFREKVRVRIVYEVEKATGGRVEIGSFYFDWKTLTAEVSPFVLHGTEGAGQQPLASIDRLKVGLKIISMVRKKIDISSLVLERPRVNILVDKDGKTNFPEPKIKSEKNADPLRQLLSLAVKKVSLRDGMFHFAEQRIPLDLDGENLQATLNYDLRGPKYSGDLGFEKLTLTTGQTLPITFSVATRVVFERDRIEVPAAHLAAGHSVVDAAGTIVNLRDPQVEFAVKAVADLSALAKPLRIPDVYLGMVNFEGQVESNAADRLTVHGHMDGRGLALRDGTLDIRGIGLNTEVQLNKTGVSTRGLRVALLGGQFIGSAELPKFETYRVKGTAHELSIHALTDVLQMQKVPWDGILSGPLELSGTLSPKAKDFQGNGRFDIKPIPATPGQAAGDPLTGNVEVAYDQRLQLVKLGSSTLNTPFSRLQISGTLGDHLDVSLTSRRLEELLPALGMISPDAPKELPVKLEPGGDAQFNGTVIGTLNSPNIAGNLAVQKFSYEGEKFDRVEAAISAGKAGVQVSGLQLRQQDASLSGTLRLSMADWKATDASAISGTLRLQGVQLAKLLTDLGQKLPVEGLLSATADVIGTLGAPVAAAKVSVEKPVMYGEHLDRFRGDVSFGPSAVELRNGILNDGPAQILVSGAYDHPKNDYRNGTFRFDVTSQNLTAERLEAVHEARPDLTSKLDVKIAGRGVVRKSDPLLEVLNGQVGLRGIVLGGKAVGNLSVDAKTTGTELTLGAAGDIRGAAIRGNTLVQLAGDYPSRGTLEVAPIKLAVVEDIASKAQDTEKMPFDGTISGHMTFAGPLKKPELLTARVEIPKIEIVPARKLHTNVQKIELAVRNEQPIVLEIDDNGIHVRSARLVGPQTNLEVLGTVSLRHKNPWDLRVNGSVNLAVLQNFEPDLLSSGVSVVNASVRGTLDAPQLSGQMEFKDASFYMEGLPNGVDKANGVVRFDKSRATIVDRLRAQTGGGDIALTGFVGYGSGEILYNLQAQADGVRVRYPEGVSTTLNANLAVSGTSLHSLVSGVVTVRRAGFNPRTDFASILAVASKPVSTPSTPNEFLRGLQFDVRIESAPNLEFQTTLTNDLQAEADLRLRGSPLHPTLAGRVAVNQGDIQFFGNKYTINRGDILFYNQSKIEPVLDMDLETRVRGILVTITFSGTLSKLNLSYRSDPPLQSNEIVALLAVGRAPGTGSSLASSQTVTSDSVLSTGGNTLLGQAVAAPISGRLQRFFGVSRLKIDPLLTGVNAVPQARLTVEQQISKDITLTYVTNLTQANQQLVRLEWAFNRTWSLIAVREENGVFGIDFLYKARFK